LYSVRYTINAELNIYYADGFKWSGRELNHWISLHCASTTRLLTEDGLIPVCPLTDDSSRDCFDTTSTNYTFTSTKVNKHFFLQFDVLLLAFIILHDFQTLLLNKSTFLYVKLFVSLFSQMQPSGYRETLVCFIEKLYKLHLAAQNVYKMLWYYLVVGHKERASYL